MSPTEPPEFPSLNPHRLRILVMNAKGGSGKTTLATNLAACYARAGVATALIDHDPQASAMQWLAGRPETLPAITGVEAHRAGAGVTRSFLLGPALEARRIIVDTPAALAQRQLGQWLGEAERVVIPVLPSAIDIKAASRFIAMLLLDPTMRARRVPVTVVANRVRARTTSFHSLERFLTALDIPCATTLRDTQNFVRGSELGEGVADMSGARTDPDRAALTSLVAWIEQTQR